VGATLPCALQRQGEGWYRNFEQGHKLPFGYARLRQKYSAQQMQVAVQHFLDHDRCIASTIRALGYPCRDVLAGWIDELHPEGHQRTVGRAPNVQQPQELKNAAVIELSTRKTSAQEIAQKFAVCRSTLYRWKNQLLGREAPASMKRQNEGQNSIGADILAFGTWEVGLLAKVTLLGSAMATIAIGAWGHKFHQATLLRWAAVLMAATGFAFAASSTFWPLLLVAFVGTLNPSSGDVCLHRTSR
jgi:transposase-like protein